MIGVVAESFADFERYLSILIASVIREGSAGWLETPVEVVEHVQSAETFLDIHQAIEKCRERRIRVHGLREKLGHRSARAALLWFHHQIERAPVTGVVVVQDLDHESGRAERLRVAVQGPWPFAVALGLPEPEVEAWVMLAFEARDSEELARLQDLQRALGFDPTHAPERLTSTNRRSNSDAKVVLEELVPDMERRREGLGRRLVELEGRGGPCGLAAFIEELRSRLLPAVRGHRRQR